jgi:ABC-type sugar transport system ATPase subunit
LVDTIEILGVSGAGTSTTLVSIAAILATVCFISG